MDGISKSEHRIQRIIFECSKACGSQSTAKLKDCILFPEKTKLQPIDRSQMMLARLKFIQLKVKVTSFSTHACYIVMVL